MNTKSARQVEVEREDLITEEDIRPENVRRRISIMIPEDVLERLRVMAVDVSKPYQTLINEILSNATLKENSTVARLDRIEKMVKRIAK